MVIVNFYQDLISPESLKVKTNRAPNALQTESCDVTSRHVFQPTAIVASRKRHDDRFLNINQTIV